jgi:hypothetical protein
MVAEERAYGAGQQIGCMLGVGVGEEQEGAARVCGTSSASPLLPKPPVRQTRIGNDAQSRIIIRGVARQLCRLIGRVVVDDDHLD